MNFGDTSMLKQLMQKQGLKYLVVLFVLIATAILMYAIAFPVLSLINFVSSLVLRNNPIFIEIIFYFTLFIIPFVVIYNFYSYSKKDLLSIVQEELPNEHTMEEIYINKENNDKDSERVRKIVLKSKIKLGIKKEWPIKVYRVKGYNILNAFAISNIKRECIIVIYDGLLNLNNREIQSIIGHEMGHILNRDSLIKILQFSALSTVTELSNLSIKLVNGLSRVGGGNIFMFLLVGMGSFFFGLMIRLIHFIMPVFNYIIAFGNRQAEYIADQYGVMASSKDSMVNSLTIIEDLEKNQATEKASALMSLLNEHPATSKRISAINNSK